MIVDDDALRACCGSSRWQQLMRAALPASCGDALLTAAERSFDALSREDWQQAFAVHSRIGSPRADDRTGAGEQAGVGGGLRAALTDGVTAYERRFGFVFLIRARGRTGAEILAALHERLDNPPEVEFANACAQQREITALRLQDLARRAA